MRMRKHVPTEKLSRQKKNSSGWDSNENNIIVLK